MAIEKYREFIQVLTPIKCKDGRFGTVMRIGIKSDLTPYYTIEFDDDKHLEEVHIDNVENIE